MGDSPELASLYNHYYNYKASSPQHSTQQGPVAVHHPPQFLQFCLLLIALHVVVHDIA